MQRFTSRSNASARYLIRVNTAHDETSPTLAVKPVPFSSRPPLSLFFGSVDFMHLHIVAAGYRKIFSRALFYFFWIWVRFRVSECSEGHIAFLREGLNWGKTP
jgi:hypothetical protein